MIDMNELLAKMKVWGFAPLSPPNLLGGLYTRRSPKLAPRASRRPALIYGPPRRPHGVSRRLAS